MRAPLPIYAAVGALVLIAMGVGLVEGTPLAEEPPRIPWPRAGERATYEAPAGAQVVYEVVGLANVMDVTGEPIKALRIDVTVRVPAADGTRESVYSEFLDRAGHRALVAGPCAALGLAFPPPGARCDDGRSIASYLEHHLPGGGGASWLWGGRVWSEAFHAHVLQLSVPRGYAAPFSFECDALTATADDVILDGQWFSADASPPTFMEVCADSAFPRRIVASWLGGHEWTRVAHEPGATELRPLGLAVDPATLPDAPGAAPPQHGVPHGHADPEAPMDLPRAVAAVLAHADGSAFRDAHGEPFLRRAASYITAEGTLLAIPVLSAMDWEIALEAHDGAVLRATVSIECRLLLPCTTSVDETSVAAAEPPTSESAERRSLPLATLRGLAEERMGGAREPEVSTTLRAEGADLAVPAGYLHRFFGPPTGDGLSVPSSMHLDSRNGATLHAYMDAGLVEAMTGYIVPR